MMSHEVKIQVQMMMIMMTISMIVAVSMYALMTVIQSMAFVFEMGLSSPITYMTYHYNRNEYTL